MTDSTPPNDTAAVFRRLRRLLDECADCNLHEKVCVVIQACIMEGWDEGPLIIWAISELGFDRRHAAIILKGAKSPIHRPWKRDADGRYFLGDES